MLGARVRSRDAPRRRPAHGLRDPPGIADGRRLDDGPRRLHAGSTARARRDAPLDRSARSDVARDRLRGLPRQHDVRSHVRLRARRRRAPRVVEPAHRARARRRRLDGRGLRRREHHRGHAGVLRPRSPRADLRADPRSASRGRRRLPTRRLPPDAGLLPPALGDAHRRARVRSQAGRRVHVPSGAALRVVRIRARGSGRRPRRVVVDEAPDHRALAVNRSRPWGESV